MISEYNLFNKSLDTLSGKRCLITTLNAHSYNVAEKDVLFKQALQSSDVLIPDGISVVIATKLLSGKSIRKIAGEDLFYYEMERLQVSKGSCFFLGSSESVLSVIKKKVNQEFPNVKVKTYSPPFKYEFTFDETTGMVKEVNDFMPDVLFIGMTAPKQEKWAFQNRTDLKAKHICCIGAVFDFYAGTVSRAPKWMINLGIEWLYRLVKEPKRMWKRYVYGNVLFVFALLNEKFFT